MENYDVILVNTGTAEKPYFKIYEGIENRNFLYEAFKIVMENPPLADNKIKRS